MKDDPLYDKTYQSDKAKCMICHLDKTYVSYSQSFKILGNIKKRLIEEKNQHEHDTEQVRTERGDPLSHEGNQFPERCQVGNSDPLNQEMLEEQQRSLSHNEQVLENEEDYEDTPNPIGSQGRKDRENIILAFLLKTDEEIFESEVIIDDEISKSQRFKRRRDNYAIRMLEEKPLNDLVTNFDRLNDHVKQSKIFQERQESFSSEYLNDNFG